MACGWGRGPRAGRGRRRAGRGRPPRPRRRHAAAARRSAACRAGSPAPPGPSKVGPRLEEPALLRGEGHGMAGQGDGVLRLGVAGSPSARRRGGQLHLGLGEVAAGESQFGVTAAATRPCALRDWARGPATLDGWPASSQRPRESSDSAWLPSGPGLRVGEAVTVQTSTPVRCVHGLRGAAHASSAEGRLMLARSKMPKVASSSARSRTAYISARPSSTSPESAMRQPRVSRACSSMSSAPTSWANSTARSAAASVSAPGRCSMPQPAALVQHLGVHGGRRQTAHQLLGRGQLLPAVAAGQRPARAGSAGPRTRRRAAGPLVVQEPQRPAW